MTIRRRSTASMKVRQIRDSPEPEFLRRFPTTGNGSEFTRSPRRCSSAGRRVRAAATETIPTITAPAAMLRRMFVGTKNMPKRAITNVLPLKSTARLAVAAVRWMAAPLSRPPALSSRKRETMSKE